MLSRARTAYRGRSLAGWRAPRLGRQIAWVIAPFGTTQVMRLATNVVLTRLLAPEVFGVMLLIHSLRTGTELLSDIGIGQSVVRSPHGEDRRFLDVAWTLQALRGALLSAVALIAALPVAQIYGKPELASYIAGISPIFLLTGLQSPGLFLAQRRVALGRRAAYDIVNTAANSLFAIALALVIPSVWALIIGLVLGTLCSTVLTYTVFDSPRPRLAWDDRHAREIIAFGKWIFLSTAIYFSAISFDRFYFAGVLPLALAGIYGVARTFSDMLGALAQRAGAFLVFPRVAAMQDRLDEAVHRVRAMRRRVLLLVAIVTGFAVAGSDAFILLAYDARYHAAAFMIPILMVSVWFGILSSFADSMLMGCGRPAPGALANGAKFVTQLIALPLAIASGNLLAALLALVLGEIVRWLALVPASLRQGFAKPLDDFALTAAMAIAALGTKVALGALGLVPTIGQWWQMHGLLHG
jgi:O-antigen/teichoic acid export membrane protein